MLACLQTLHFHKYFMQVFTSLLYLLKKFNEIFFIALTSSSLIYCLKSEKILFQTWNEGMVPYLLFKVEVSYLAFLGTVNKNLELKIIVTQETFFNRAR